MPDTADDLAYLTATELARRIAAKELSPVEVLEDTLTRVQHRNPELNAFVHLAEDEARDAARRAEKAVVEGRRLPPLHGVPTALKDLFDFRPGWPTTFGGIRALRDYRGAHHCTYSERMDAAGAIVIGKTNSPVMGFRGTCDNPLFGATRNPFDLARNSGGSSGGSAAAVAAGLLPLAEGTDGGGSVRIPAAWCNLVGFKPSFGRVPYVVRPNAFTGLNPFLFESVLTRTVADAALGLSVLTGYDDRDPFSLQSPVDYVGALKRSIDGLRVGYTSDFGIYPVERAVADVVAAAVRGFADCGAIVDDAKIALPFDQHELSDLWCRLIGTADAVVGFKAEGIDLLRDHRGDLPEEYLRWVEPAHTRTVLELSQDQVMRTAVFDALQAALQEHDLLVSPTVACTPVLNRDDGNTLGPTSINGVDIDPSIGWCLTYLANFTGHPAVSVPAGLTPDGLPVGMQIIGRRGADETVMAAAAAFEQARPWAGHYAHTQGDLR